MRLDCWLSSCDTMMCCNAVLGGLCGIHGGEPGVPFRQDLRQVGCLHAAGQGLALLDAVAHVPAHDC